MNNNSINEDIYNQYFGRQPTSSMQSPEIDRMNDTIFDSRQVQRLHTLESVHNVEFSIPVLRQMADENINDLEQLALLLKKLCNAAWGDGWGELSPDLKKGEDNTTLILPQITVETNTRDIDDAMNGPKPKLTDIVPEVDGNGNETGDVFLIYRQWYAYNVEFNFYGRNTKEARDLMNRFERLIAVYTGYLKRHGVGEMWFESEVNPKCSLNYDESAFMRCIYYYIRFEAIMPVRHSMINRINAEIGVNELNTAKVKSLLEANRSDMIEFEFFDGDNGITYQNEGGN